MRPPLIPRCGGARAQTASGAGRGHHKRARGPSRGAKPAVKRASARGGQRDHFVLVRSRLPISVHAISPSGWWTRPRSLASPSAGGRVRERHSQGRTLALAAGRGGALIGVDRRGARCRAKREPINTVHGLSPESHGRNLALTVLHVPYSLETRETQTLQARRAGWVHSSEQAHQTVCSNCLDLYHSSPDSSERQHRSRS